MSIHDLLAWLVGGGALLYFTVAMLKPEWFLYIPPEGRLAQAQHLRLLSMDRSVNEGEQAPLIKGHYMKS